MMLMPLDRFQTRLAVSEGSAGSRARRAAPGSMALYVLIETPAYILFISYASVRYVSGPNQGIDRCSVDMLRLGRLRPL